jgi:hypothetical protein
VHLMTCRLKNERARGQQTLIPSGTENHCHNEFLVSKQVRRGERPTQFFFQKIFTGNLIRFVRNFTARLSVQKFSLLVQGQAGCWLPCSSLLGQQIHGPQVASIAA